MHNGDGVAAAVAGGIGAVVVVAVSTDMELSVPVLEVD